ncbi:MAG TPA: hypothetical protein VKR99_08725 [Candidatus Eremiobacteraceae bacterium]|nr:hypothetical protein [Candidatus Eremiobacteraceae bacterium]
MNLKRTAAALALVAGMLAGTAAFADMKDTGKDTMVNGQQHGRFGGPVYAGQPNLAATASLVAAGGGAANYSTATALVAMVGKDTVDAEVTKLSNQYGKAAVGMWLKTFDFAVNDSLKIATNAGVKLPAPALSGTKLATALVAAGQDSDGTFQIEYLLDKAVSHKIHVQVMNDIDNTPGFGKKADLDYHLISNQAFFDVGTALKVPNIKLAPLH